MKFLSSDNGFYARLILGMIFAVGSSGSLLYFSFTAKGEPERAHEAQKAEIVKAATAAATATAKTTATQVAKEIVAAAEPKPDLGRAWDLYGDVKAYAFDKARFDEAVDRLLQAESLSPRNVEVQQLLGRVYANNDRASDAQQHFEKALGLDQRHLGALLGLSTILLNRCDYDSARPYIERAHDIAPTDPEVMQRERRLAKKEPCWPKK